MFSAKLLDGQIFNLKEHEGQVVVLDFWATWCGPCIKELPYFEKLGEFYADKGVEVLLVSLDFPKPSANYPPKIYFWNQSQM